MVNVGNIFEAIMETMKDQEAWKNENGNRKPCRRDNQGEEREHLVLARQSRSSRERKKVLSV